MKLLSKLALYCSVGLVAITPCWSASPVVQVFKAESAIMGESVTLHADVSDADGDLQAVVFSISGPGIVGWQTLGTRPIAGAQGSAEVIWTPSQTGIFTARADAVDATAGGSAQRVFEIYSGRRVLSAISVPSGANTMFSSNGELVTKNDPSMISTKVSSGGNLIFWAGGRIVLKAGFKAESGSNFWAAVDHNINGYSDVEEVTDTDHDGIFDAWEVDHGLNPLDPSDAGRVVVGLGITNLQAFLAGKDPRDSNYANTLPSGFNIVLKTPANQFLGVKTDWSITPL